jgi:hypothetical protein
MRPRAQRDHCLSLGAPCWALETNSDVVSYASASAQRSSFGGPVPLPARILVRAKRYAGENLDPLVQSEHSYRGDFRWRFHCHVGFCTGSR